MQCQQPTQGTFSNGSSPLCLRALDWHDQLPSNPVPWRTRATPAAALLPASVAVIRCCQAGLLGDETLDLRSAHGIASERCQRALGLARSRLPSALPRSLPRRRLHGCRVVWKFPQPGKGQPGFRGRKGKVWQRAATRQRPVLFHLGQSKCPIMCHSIKLRLGESSTSCCKAAVMK